MAIYFDAAKIAEVVAQLSGAALRRNFRDVVLPEVEAGLVAANTGAEVGAAGVAEASKILKLGANKNVDEVHTAALYLGAGAGTLVTLDAAELNALENLDDELAALEGAQAELALLAGLADELTALSGMDTELGLLAGLTANAATLNAVPSNPGNVAQGVLRVSAAVKSTETVTIGADVYEFDAGEGTVTGTNILVDIEASTIKSEGTLTVDTQPTASDTFTIGVGAGEKLYTIVPNGTANADGEVNRGTNLATAQAAIVAAVNGTDGYNVAHTQVVMGDFAANAAVITAIDGGTAGDLIATTETFTAGTNIFDAATLGTTTAGADSAAGDATDALIAAINASGTEAVTAFDESANEVLILADAVGVVALATTETLAGVDNTWSAVTMTGGSAAAAINIAKANRVPTATEVALGIMRFAVDFLPTMVQVQVRVTASGAIKAWDGAIAIIDAAGDINYVEIDNGGATDWAATDTAYVILYS